MLSRTEDMHRDDDPWRMHLVGRLAVQDLTKKFLGGRRMVIIQRNSNLTMITFNHIKNCPLTCRIIRTIRQPPRFDPIQLSKNPFNILKHQISIVKYLLRILLCGQRTHPYLILSNYPPFLKAGFSQVEFYLSQLTWYASIEGRKRLSAPNSMCIHLQNCIFWLSKVYFR